MKYRSGGADELVAANGAVVWQVIAAVGGSGVAVRLTRSRSQCGFLFTSFHLPRINLKFLDLPMFRAYSNSIQVYCHMSGNMFPYNGIADNVKIYNIYDEYIK